MAVTEQDWLQAQYSVLGSALLEPDLVPMVVSKTDQRDYSGPCRSIFAALKHLFTAGKPVDVVTLAAELGPEYHRLLKELMEITPSAANCGYYITVCKEQAKVLAIRELGSRLSEAQSVDAIRPLLDQANGLLVEKQSLQVATMEDMMHQFFDRHKTPKEYLSWPISALNDEVYCEPGDLVVVGGYPSAGKSAWALQCAYRWAKNHRVGFYSLETSKEKLFDRQISAVSGIGMERIKRNLLTDDDWSKACSVSAEVSGRTLDLVPASGMSVADVKAVATMYRHDIIVLDYLQLLQGPGASRYEQVTKISLDLHTMAQTMGVTVIALSQLSRAGRGGDAPGMSALRESGQIEQDADLIMLLYLEDESKPEGPRIMRIAKNKEGRCFGMKLIFDGNSQTFTKAYDGSVASKYAAAGRANKRKAYKQESQMSLLPNDSYTPFEEEQT